MWHEILINNVAPILVGVVLALFSKWLDKKDDD
ncbi:TPA: type I toxin-antitoxin system Fst family toxin [Streptococcus suis]